MCGICKCYRGQWLPDALSKASVVKGCADDIDTWEVSLSAFRVPILLVQGYIGQFLVHLLTDKVNKLVRAFNMFRKYDSNTMSYHNRSCKCSIKAQECNLI